jgi:hypothetical protein
MIINGSDHGIIHSWKKILFQNIAAVFLHNNLLPDKTSDHHIFFQFPMTSKAFSVAESLDIFVSIFLFWFNPNAYFYKRSR